MDRRRPALRCQRSDETAGIGFRTRPARRGRREMQRLLPLLASAAAFVALPAAAQSVAIVAAKLVIGDGSAPIDHGTVLLRGDLAVAAGAQSPAAHAPLIAAALNDLPASFDQLAATQPNVGRMKAAGVRVGLGM